MQIAPRQSKASIVKPRASEDSILSSYHYLPKNKFVLGTITRVLQKVKFVGNRFIWSGIMLIMLLKERNNLVKGLHVKYGSSVTVFLCTSINKPLALG